MSGYGNDNGLTDYLTGLGLSLPSGAPSAAVLRQIGSSYVDAAYEPRLQCSRRSGGFAQERAWPREGHKVNRQDVPDDLIPQAWVDASYHAAYLQATNPGWATGGRDPSRVTKREKVDVLEREFFGPSDSVASNAAPGFNVDPLIDGMVSVWLCPEGRGDFLFRVV